MTRLPPEREQEVLDLLAEHGPLNDETIAGRLGGGTSTGDVLDTTDYLNQEGLIKDSEFAPGRWQLTDAGRART